MKIKISIGGSIMKTFIEVLHIEIESSKCKNINLKSPFKSIYTKKRKKKKHITLKMSKRLKKK